ncbi:MAG: TonB family protein [Pseudomonadales bacterium]
MLQDQSHPLGTSGWYLITRDGESAVRVVPGMHLGEDANGDLSFEAAHAWVSLVPLRDGRLEVQSASSAFELDVNPGSPTGRIAVDSQAGANIHLGRNVIVLDVDFAHPHPLRDRTIIRVVADDPASVGAGTDHQDVIRVPEALAPRVPAETPTGPRLNVAVLVMLSAVCLLLAYVAQQQGAPAATPAAEQAPEPASGAQAPMLVSVSTLFDDETLPNAGTISFAISSLKALLVAYPDDARVVDAMEQLTLRLLGEAQRQRDLGDMDSATRMLEFAATTDVATAQVRAAFDSVGADLALSDQPAPQAVDAADAADEPAGGGAPVELDAPAEPVGPVAAAEAAEDPDVQPVGRAAEVVDVADVVETVDGSEASERLAPPAAASSTVVVAPGGESGSGGAIDRQRAPDQVASGRAERQEQVPDAADAADALDASEVAEVADDSSEPARGGLADDPGSVESRDRDVAPGGLTEVAPGGDDRVDLVRPVAGWLLEEIVLDVDAAQPYAFHRDLRLADVALAEGRLTGADDSAVARYRRALDLAPESVRAQRGMMLAGERLIERARELLEAEDYPAALALLAVADQTGVNTEAIDGLRQDALYLRRLGEAEAGRFERLHFMSELNALNQEPPRFPRRAPRGAEGYVDLEMTVTISGEVRDIVVLGDPPGYFERAALQAVSQWTFEPTLENGRPIPVRTSVRVTFRGS